MKLSYVSYLCSDNVFEYDDFIEFYLTTDPSFKISIINKSITSTEDLHYATLSIYSVYKNSQTKKQIIANILFRYNDTTYCARINKPQNIGILTVMEDIFKNENDLVFYKNTKPTPLYSAIHSYMFTNRCKIIMFLLNKGFSVNEITIHGDNALLKLLQYSHVEKNMTLIETIVQKTTDLNFVNNDLYNALILCVFHKHFKTFKLLLRQPNIDMNFTIGNNIYLVWFCLFLKRHDFFREVVRSNSFDVNVLNTERENILMLCIIYNQYSLIHLFIDTIDINHRDIYDMSCISMCIIYHRKQILKFILSKRKDVDLNCIHFLIEHSILTQNLKQNIVYLLENGADVNYIDGNGNSPLIHSIIHEQFDITELLIQYNCDLNVINKEGESAVQLLCKKKKYSLVKLLICYKACIDVSYINFNLLNHFFSENNFEMFLFAIKNNINTYPYDKNCLLCFYFNHKQTFEQNSSSISPFANCFLKYLQKTNSSNVIKYCWKKRKRKKIINTLLVKNLNEDTIKVVNSFLFSSNSVSEKIANFKNHFLYYY